MPDEKELTRADVEQYATHHKDPIPPKYPPALLAFLVLVLVILPVFSVVVHYESQAINRIVQRIHQVTKP